MAKRLKYCKKPNQAVLAIRLDLETPGLSYRKWGGPQHAKAGDWLVKNGNEVYTVDARTFARTYRKQAEGFYNKKAPVWAESARSAGTVKTKEGQTRYARGDFIVSNYRDGRDSYAVTAKKFRQMYQRAR